jgi:uncharacterized protein (DUF1330 family)
MKRLPSCSITVSVSALRSAMMSVQDDAYTKEYVPVVRPIIAKSGGKLVAVSQDPTTIEGAPQKSRVAINVFESLEKAKAWREAADYKEARKIGDKYAKFRAYVVEGFAQ